MSLSAWERTFWGKDDSSISLSNSWRAQLGPVSATLNLNYNKFSGEGNYATSLSMSLPLSVFDKRVSSFANINAIKGGSTTYNAGLSANVTENLSVSSSIGYEEAQKEKSYSLSSSYQGKNVQVNAGVAQYGASQTYNGSISGGILFLPEQRDVVLGRNLNGTISVVNVGDIEGVGFYSSPYMTNGNGNLVLPVSSYLDNTLMVDPSTLPLDIELMDTHSKLLLLMVL